MEGEIVWMPRVHAENLILSRYYYTQQVLQRAYINHTCSICILSSNNRVSVYLKRTTWKPSELSQQQHNLSGRVTWPNSETTSNELFPLPVLEKEEYMFKGSVVPLALIKSCLLQRLWATVIQPLWRYNPTASPITKQRLLENCNITNVYFV